MNPDNDTPVWKSKISGIFVGAMRGFITQRIQNQFVAGNETVLRTPQVERKESVSHIYGSPIGFQYLFSVVES